MSLTDRYPINCSELQKGQLLTIHELQNICGRKSTDSNWPFVILALREFIQEHTDFTVKITTEGLRVLTDSEAMSHNHRRFNGHLAGAMRRHERNTLVNANALTPEERMVHSSNLVNEGRYIVALQQTTKRISVAAHRRALPELFKTESAPEPGEEGAL